MSFIDRITKLFRTEPDPDPEPETKPEPSLTDEEKSEALRQRFSRLSSLPLPGLMPPGYGVSYVTPFMAFDAAMKMRVIEAIARALNREPAEVLDVMVREGIALPATSDEVSAVSIGALIVQIDRCFDKPPQQAEPTRVRSLEQCDDEIDRAMRALDDEP